MADRSVCTPLNAESDAESNTFSAPNAASVTVADKVINTKLDSSQVKGDPDEEELLKGLLTDDFCHVCEAVLLFESQRLSHYEGKKHAQKLKLYLQAKRAEKEAEDTAGPQRTMISDEDQFCELCNMVFSSSVVAKSHYKGKIHAKKLRKQGHQSTVIDITCAEMHTSPSVTQASANADQKSAREGVVEHLQGPTAPSASLSTEVDLKDPNRYCTLCTASFNNHQMALQHYNGRKHQKNQARQDLLKTLGEDVQQANSLMCQMCGVEFESVEMYQAHMQGSKHQIRGKKVADLCKSQQKVYNSFADELADYIQVQRARGIAPKNSQLPPQVDREKEVEEDDKEVSDKADIVQVAKLVPNFPPTFNSPHQSHPVCYYPVEGWRPPYLRPVRGTSYGWNCNAPPSGHPSLGSPQFTSKRTGRKRHRKQSSSSSYTSSSSSSSSHSSSYSSSYSSSASDSDDGDHRRREKKRRTGRDRKEGGRRAQDHDSDKEPRRRKVQRRVRVRDSAERKRKSDAAESEERRRKRRKKNRKARRGEKTSQEEVFEEEGAKRAARDIEPQDLVEKREGTEVHAEVEMNLEQQDGEQDEPGKAKYRKEKRRAKEKVDTRTEEEKLWDESILGC